MLPYVTILGRTLGMYSVMAVIGIAFAVVFFVLNKKRTGFDAFGLALFGLIVFTGLLIGGHLLYGITQHDLIFRAFKNIDRLSFKDFFTVMAVAFGGNVFYGGLIGSFITIGVYLKVRKLGPERNAGILDVYSCAVPLFHAFGRVGCFFGGCCYGIESACGFTAHGNEYSPDVNDVNRFPVQLLEASLNLLLFAFLVILLKKGVMKGNLMWIYGSIYPVIRFFDEFLRGDAIRGFVFGLSTSQWISIFVFVLSVTMIIIRVCKKPAPAMPVPTQEESIQATDESIQATDVPSSHLPETAPATDISFNKTDTI